MAPITEYTPPGWRDDGLTGAERVRRDMEQSEMAREIDPDGAFAKEWKEINADVAAQLGLQPEVEQVPPAEAVVSDSATTLTPSLTVAEKSRNILSPLATIGVALAVGAAFIASQTVNVTFGDPTPTLMPTATVTPSKRTPVPTATLLPGQKRVLSK